MNEKEKIRQFISPNIKNFNLGDGDDIFTLGFVNSLFALKLVNFVENEFGIVVEDDDFDLDNFRSVNALADLVLRKRR